MFLGAIVLPILAVWTIFKKPVASFNQPSYKARWRALIEGINLQTRGSRAFLFVHLTRRILFVLVAFNEKIASAKIFQILWILMINLACIIYFGGQRPLKKRVDNSIEMFNQLIVAFSTFHILLFTDFVQDASLQYEMGWSMVGTFSILIVVNLFYVFKVIANVIKLLSVYSIRWCERHCCKESHHKKEKVMTPEELAEADRRRFIGLRLLKEAKEKLSARSDISA